MHAFSETDKITYQGESQDGTSGAPIGRLHPHTTMEPNV